MSVLFVASVVPYLIPTVIAAWRDHPKKTGIFLINLLLGWTVVGWLVALIWALTGAPAVQPIAAPGDEARPGGLKLQGRDPRFDR
jgi:4-amino-4-deoxy-L-arabinose transferase-like glycosyltransferase